MSAVVKEVVGKGRGLVAIAPISAGAVIVPSAPATAFPNGALTGTPLDQYAFEWDADREAILFGPISLVNHSDSPNAEVTLDPIGGTASLTATRDISEGEEICYDYDTELWFEVQP